MDRLSLAKCFNFWVRFSFRATTDTKSTTWSIFPFTCFIPHEILWWNIRIGIWWNIKDTSFLMADLKTVPFWAILHCCKPCQKSHLLAVDVKQAGFPSEGICAVTVGQCGPSPAPFRSCQCVSMGKSIIRFVSEPLLPSPTERNKEINSLFLSNTVAWRYLKASPSHALISLLPCLIYTTPVKMTTCQHHCWWPYGQRPQSCLPGPAMP